MAAGAAVASATGGLPPAIAGSTAQAAAGSSPLSGSARADQAYTIRVACARSQRAHSLPAHPANGDEARFAATYIANYGKGLPHNALGEVDPAAYTALLKALGSDQPADFAAIPLGGKARLADPQGSYAFGLEGADSACLAVAVPPAFSSAQEAGEMVELYWQALARDVPFAAYATDHLIARAAADLSRLSDFRGPKEAGAVTPATIFRGGLAGEISGPYLSQFLWLPVPYGPLTMTQQYPVAPARSFMTTYANWLTVQQGGYTPPKAVTPARPAPTRYMIAGRDLATHLKSDFTYQAYLNAALILTKLLAPVSATNPYRTAPTQVAVSTFGPQHLFDLVARVANTALKAVWYQKWAVHRRLRPEEFGGRVHNHMRGAAHYPLHADLLSISSVLDAVFRQTGSYLLPMAYPDGCPLHPAYPAGHVAIAGACVTVLKAWFDQSFVLPAPVVASPDGHALLPYTGAPLTVGGELHKLAGNVMMGRDFGGVHWRSDGAAGLQLGEAVALAILADERAAYTGAFGGFTLTTFDGTTITI
jgi:hypothetical protein